MTVQEKWNKIDKHFEKKAIAVKLAACEINKDNKEWRESKLDNNLINKCSQDNNFSHILSKLVISRKFNNEEIYTINNFNNITERLLHETIVSLEAAKMVQGITGTPPTIHADVNSKDTALSYKMLNVIMGMVQGMGFPIKVKPDAWAADIADMFTR